jgi:hypothetical protein
MDDDTRRRLLRAVIGEDQPGRGRVRRWTLLEAAERAGLVLNHTRRGLQELREQNPPLVWGDVDATSGEELWWLLPQGLNELDRLEDAIAERTRRRNGVRTAAVDGPL